MSYSIKSQKEYEIMRHGGKILAQIVQEVVKKTQDGVSTLELDTCAYDLCKNYKVKPAFLGYNHYPATLCVGINETVVHGIPSKLEILKEGDIVSIDMGIIYKDFYSDMAVTVGIGHISQNAKNLLDTTKEALYHAIEDVKEGNTIGDIGYAIQSTVEKNGFSVVKQMVGHGIGKLLHEEPQIPGYGFPHEGIKLTSGMTLAIEAIINEGIDKIIFLNDGWTTKTFDGKLSALFEHTIIVRKEKAEILTKE